MYIFQNGGSCKPGINDSYSCECPVGFHGSFCEIEPNVFNVFQKTSPCENHDCKHGVCFQENLLTDYICKCDDGYTGILKYIIYSCIYVLKQYISMLADGE